MSKKCTIKFSRDVLLQAEICAYTFDRLSWLLRVFQDFEQVRTSKLEAASLNFQQKIIII